MSQQDHINWQYNKEKSSLDIQCKQNMTDWCKQEYSRVDNNHRQDLREDKQLSEAASRTNSTSTIIVITTLLVVGAVVGTTAVAAHCAVPRNC